MSQAHPAAPTEAPLPDSTAVPLILWRVSNYADLLGTGGIAASARWHTAGHPVVYLAENPSSALLENLVHLELDEEDRPATYQLLRIEVERLTPYEDLPARTLPANWRIDESVTRALGDAWIERNSTALLRVPSVLTPETWNWVLNARHPDSRRLRIASIEKPLYDSRLRT